MSPHPHLLAVCLALVGQVVGVLGLPVIRGGMFGSGRQDLSPCGCDAKERAAGLCCCKTSGGGACGLPAPTPPKPSCCQSAELVALPAKHSCCSTSPTEHKSSCRHEPETAETELVVTWTGGALRQKCRGTADNLPHSASPTGISPGAPAGFAIDCPSRGLAIVSLPSPAEVVRTPVDPPPRRFSF